MKSIFTFIAFLIALLTIQSGFACTNFAGLYQFENDPNSYSIKQTGCKRVSFGSLPNMTTVNTDGTFQYAYELDVLDSEGKKIGKTTTYFSAEFLEDLLYIVKKDLVKIPGADTEEYLFPSTKNLTKTGNLINIETFLDGSVSINVAKRVK